MSVGAVGSSNSAGAAQYTNEVGSKADSPGGAQTQKPAAAADYSAAPPRPVNDKEAGGTRDPAETAPSSLAPPGACEPPPHPEPKDDDPNTWSSAGWCDPGTNVAAGTPPSSSGAAFPFGGGG